MNYNNCGEAGTLLWESWTCKESKIDLSWWRSHLPENNGRSLITPSVKPMMESDASTQGWGAYSQGRRAGGPWQRVEKFNIL